MSKSFQRTKVSVQKKVHNQPRQAKQQQIQSHKGIRSQRQHKHITTEYEYDHQQSNQQCNDSRRANARNSNKINVYPHLQSGIPHPKHQRKYSSFLNDYKLKGKGQQHQPLQNNEDQGQYPDIEGVYEAQSQQYEKVNKFKLRKNQSNKNSKRNLSSTNKINNLVNFNQQVMEPRSTFQIQQRFKQIQLIMGSQNQNLRRQKDYLLQTIYKMQAKQKQYKNHVTYYQQKCVQLQQQNRVLRDKYEKARDFITHGIDKMEQVICQDPELNGSYINNIQQVNNSNNGNESLTTTETTLNQQIQQLNNKFDAIMYQYQKTKAPQLRKNCMEIAKELRKLRKMQDVRVNLNNVNQKSYTNSRPNSRNSKKR